MMRTYGRVVGKRLRSWRLEHGWRLLDESRKLHVSVATISQWERGLRFPSGDNLVRLSQMFNRPLCLLFCTGRRRCPLYKEGLQNGCAACSRT